MGADARELSAHRVAFTVGHGLAPWLVAWVLQLQPTIRGVSPYFFPTYNQSPALNAVPFEPDPFYRFYRIMVLATLTRAG